ncbi:MAG TPA: hypothetical protein VMV72_11400 [Verrucomicrobiae bacterium]|nr:hypothetical protein [Verrucomicrobiae bacterium]
MERARGTLSAAGIRKWIGILLAVLVVLTALRQGLLIGRIGFDGENSPTESESLFAVSRLHNGGPLYLDYTRPPYAITAYMPLFYWSSAWVARPARTWLEMIVAARWSVYPFWVGIGVAIFLLARQVGCSRRAALLATLLWGASELGQEWANSFRPDAAALFFSLAALWVYQRGRAPIHLAGSVALLIVGTMYKHTVFAPLVVISLEEILRRRLGRAIAAATTWGAVLAAVAIAAQHATNGRFALNVFYSLAEAPSWWWTWSLLLTALTMGAVVFFGATIACAAPARFPGVGLWKRYFVVSLGLAFARSRIYGTWTNHYLEPFAAGCVLAGVLTDDLLAYSPNDVVRRAHIWWLATALGLSVALSFEQGWRILLSSRDNTSWKELATYVGKLDGPVLSEEPYLAVRSGRTPYMIDTSLFAHMQRIGRFDDTDLLRRIEQGELAAIISKTPLDDSRRPVWAFPPRWLIPMRKRYHLDARYVVPEPFSKSDDFYYVYRPKEGL